MSNIVDIIAEKTNGKYTSLFVCIGSDIVVVLFR